MAFPTIGGTEGIIILVVILIVFGVGKLPQVGGALGKGIREFRRGKSGLLAEIEEEEELIASPGAEPELEGETENENENIQSYPNVSR